MNTLKNGFVVSTANEVAAMMAPHGDIINGLLCGVPIKKRGLLLTPDEVRNLRKWACDNVITGILVMNEETAKALLGLVPVDPKQRPAFIKLGEVSYASENNTHNRLLMNSRLGDATNPGYTNDMLQGLWGYADALQVAADGIIASAQHRAGAYLRAKSINPSLEAIEFPISVGLPPQFIDFIDRGRERKSSDMNFRDETMFTLELVGEVFPEMPVPSDMPKLRQQWSTTIETVRVNVHVRCRGIDVHPSSKQAPTKKDALLVDARFGRYTDLQRLVLKIATIERGIDGKPAAWTKVFSPWMIATAIVLRCNADHDDADNLALDWDYVDSMLTALSESSGDPASGPFGGAMGDITLEKAAIKKAGGGVPNAKEIFGCLVAAIGQYDDAGSTSTVWVGKRARTKKEKTKDKTYRCFEGVDIGYQAKSEE